MSKHINLLRNIYSGVWAIEAQAAQALLPRAAKFLLGEAIEIDPGVTPEAKSISTGNASQPTTIAVVGFKDVIIKNDQGCGPEGTTSKSYQIDLLADDPKVKAIILDIDSPGGSVDAVQIPSAAIRRARERKPVVAYISSGMAASAAYWIASQCDEIYCEFDSDAVGSIGVYFTLADFKGYFESLGLKIKDIYATGSTEKNKPFRDALEGDDTLLREQLDFYNSQFESTVRASRPDVNTGVFKGAMYFAQDAMKNGLIDGIKTIDEVAERCDELAQLDKYNSSMKLFGNKPGAQHKFEALATLAATAAEDRTEEQFTAAQAELNAAGFGVIITNDSTANANVAAFVARREELSAIEAREKTTSTAVANAISAAKAYVGEEAEFETVDAAMTSVIKIAQSASPIESSERGGEAEIQAAEDDVNKRISEMSHNKTADNN